MRIQTAALSGVRFRLRDCRVNSVSKLLIFFSGLLTGVVLVVGGGYLLYGAGQRLVEEHRAEWMPDFKQELFESAAELAAARDEYSRWVAAGEVAIWMVDAGALERAESLAAELLAGAEKYPRDWNHGNAIHRAHIALGRVALHRGNLEKAKDHLKEAGETSGSPQLDTFGPNMLLARELLERGEREAVLSYFAACRKFWDMGDAELTRWSESVRAGEMPAFGSNLVH